MTKETLTESRIEFLKEAAHLLAIPSPTTSAALGTARHKLLEEQDADLEAPKEWDALRREVCGACGNLMVPGWSCEVTRETRTRKLGKRRRKDTSKQLSRSEKDMVYSCLRCNRRTVQTLQPRPPRRIPNAHLGSTYESVPREPGTEATSKDTKSANASSKQRKKARKGGLQALLEKSKTPTPGQGSLGLDLMDFMQ